MFRPQLTLLQTTTKSKVDIWTKDVISPSHYMLMSRLSQQNVEVEGGGISIRAVWSENVLFFTGNHTGKP